MESLRKLIAKINTELSDLSASQRLVIGLCVVLICGSLLWLVRFSAEPQWVRLLEEPMTTEQLASARQSLPAGKFRIAGDRVLVRPQDRHELFWALQSAGALPQDTSITFSKLIEDDSPFRPESENHFRRRVALQNELAKVIASSAIIRKAEVFITETSDRRINARNTRPTASIHVTPVPGQLLDQEMVTACASIVAGAVPGLFTHRVSVVDGNTLRTYKPPDPEDSFAQGLLAEARKNEDHLHDKLAEQLSYIQGVRVAVTVELDAAKTQMREYTYAEPAVAEEQTNTTSTRSARPSGEAGVGPNVGQSIGGDGGAGVASSDETKTKFQDQPIRSETTTVKTPLTRKRVTVAVGIPWSYVAGVVQQLKNKTEEPGPDEVEEQFRTESARVRAIAKNVTMAQSDDDVTVELLHDFNTSVTVLPDGSVVAVSQADSPAMGDALGMIRDYGPDAGLGFLALAGLFMLVRLTKRSAREAALYAGMTEARGTESMSGDEVVIASAPAVGMAEPSDDSTLVGREVDETSLRGSEMAQQIAEFIKEHPNSAARIVKRWTDVED